MLHYMDVGDMSPVRLQTLTMRPDDETGSCMHCHVSFSLAHTATPLHLWLLYFAQQQYRQYMQQQQCKDSVCLRQTLAVMYT